MSLEIESITERSIIRSGDLLAWSSDKDQGWGRFVKDFIRFMTMSEYAHVGIAYIKDGVTYVLEATQPRIVFRPIKPEEIFYVVPMKIKDTTEMYEIFQSYVGCRYSIIDCIRAFFGIVTDKDDNWQCAELATDVFQRLNLDFKPDRITPSGVVKAAISFAKTGLWIHE